MRAQRNGTLYTTQRNFIVRASVRQLSSCASVDGDLRGHSHEVAAELRPGSHVRLQQCVTRHAQQMRLWLLTFAGSVIGLPSLSSSLMGVWPGLCDHSLLESCLHQ